MKGMVFTEFIEFVEDKFGFEMSNDIISESNLKSGGVYTAVGTYDFQEMVSLLTNLSRKSKIAIPDLLEVYGNHLFYRFVELYPDLVSKQIGLFNFIEKIDGYIHVEVKKLYPDAELPQIIVRSRTKYALMLLYKSERKLGNFALGLLKAAADYFEEPMKMSMYNLVDDGAEVEFILEKTNV